MVDDKDKVQELTEEELEQASGGLKSPGSTSHGGTKPLDMSTGGSGDDEEEERERDRGR